MKCFRCGSAGLLTNSMSGIARTAGCRKCNRRGHFARVFRDLGNAVSSVVDSEEDQKKFIFQVNDKIEDCDTFHADFDIHN